MNFNKDYPIAILDTNIAITFPNILNILKGCNIVIPYTLIDEIDKVIEEGFCDNNEWRYYNAGDFVNNFLALSEKANLSKDGYKLENDCMLYLDIDKNNSYHKDINLDSKKQDIKFIAEAKNLKEKYNDMEVVLISSDKIMKITASIFDVKVKLLEEFITEYLKEEFKLNILFDLLVESKQYIERVNKYSVIGGANYYRVRVVREIILKIVSDNKDIDGLYKLSEIYDSEEIYEKIFTILSENKDIDGLYKLSESYNPNNKIYEEISNILANDKNINGLYELAKYYNNAYNKIFTILSENKDIDGLYKLSESYDSEEIYEKIFEILSEAEDLEGLFKLSESYDSEEIYEKICEILDKEEDKNKLYELTKNKDIKNLLSNSSHPKINEIMFKMLIDKIDELEN